VKVSPPVAPGDGPAPAGAAATDSASNAPTLRARLDRLRDLDGTSLREEWRRLCRSEPPRLSPDLLRRAIAYRMQELEFGGLPKWARQSLAGGAVEAPPASAAGEPELRPPELTPLKPGTRLVREWHGRTHVVTVLDDVFEFEGRHYRSLTQIACEITGAHWSGPRFFGLTKRRAAPSLDAAPAFEAASPPAISAGEASSPTQSDPCKPSIEARAQAGAHESEGRRVGQRAKENADG
jgi:hypothetical protein